MSTYLAWAEEKCQLAHSLESGCLGAGYSDAVIVLCTCISAMASRLWIEDKYNDRKRFVEAVVKFSEPPHDATKISLPLLIQENEFWKQRLRPTEISLRLTEIYDKTESELLQLCTDATQTVCRKVLREFSYANILYRDLRCGFVHTYLPTENARLDDPLKGIFDSPPITYVNTPRGRKIHFGLEWIAGTVKNIARGMDIHCDSLGRHLGENVGIDFPNTWWVDA